MRRKIQCADCFFWERDIDPYDGHQKTSGECHRHAPKTAIAGHGSAREAVYFDVNAAWAVTDEQDWCGDAEPAEVCE